MTIFKSSLSLIIYKTRLFIYLLILTGYSNYSIHKMLKYFSMISFNLNIFFIYQVKI